jgi:hypothetical protein
MAFDSLAYREERAAQESRHGQGVTKILSHLWDPFSPHAEVQRKWFSASFTNFAKDATVVAGVVTWPGVYVWIRPQSAAQFADYVAQGGLIAAGSPAGQVCAVITRW